MHIDISEIPELVGNSEEPSLPSLPEALYLQTLGQPATAPAQRELLADVIPRSLEKYLTISCSTKRR